MGLDSLRRVALRWIRRISDDLAADAGWQGFVVRGIRIIHPNILVDQSAIRAAILSEIGLLHPKTDLSCLRRIRVYVAPNRGTDLVMAARWSGGIFDRGEARVEGGDGHPARIAAAVIALVASEQDADEAAPAVSR